MLKTTLNNLYKSAVELNHQNIVDLFDYDENAILLDLGCDNGLFTQKIANKIGTKNTYGVEIVPERIKAAQKKGIQVKNFNLNQNFSFPDKYFHAIHANQVIEHLTNSDNFLSEIHRILKPGGYAVISTENQSSWCNIFASIMGWQIFSLTNFSGKALSIGNPLALHRGKKVEYSSWNHVRIYSIFGLKEYFETYGFKVEKIVGAGYFPLPSIFGKIDPIHSHFITFKIRKK
ncbi:MAG: class I SAM-dependent methyltransferase [Patescibacteria group bacterium]